MKISVYFTLFLSLLMSVVSIAQTDINPEDSLTNKLRIKALNEDVTLGKATYNTFYNLALLHIAIGDTTTALQDYSQSISMNGKFAASFINRGVIYQKRKEVDLAEKDFTQAISIEPKNAVAINNRGFLYLQMEQYDKALSDFNKSIEADKLHTEAYMNKVEIYTRQRKKERAMEACAALIDAIPDDPKGYTTRAAVYVDFGDIPNAMRDQDRAVELSGLDPAYLIERSRFKDEIGDDLGSLSDCDLAIAKAPGVAYYHLMRSRPLYDLEEFGEVIESCDKAIVLDPKEFRAMVMKANVLDAYGMHSEAAELYEQAIVIAPLDHDAYVQLAISEYAQGDMDGALIPLERYMNKNPGNKDVIRTHGQLLGEMGRFEEALDDFNELTLLNPEDAQSFYLAGLINDTLKNLNLACEQMLTADGLGSREAHRYLRVNCRSSMNAKLMEMEDLEEAAYYLELKGDFEGAIKKYTDAISIVADTSRLYYNRGKAKRKMNDHEGAILDYAEAIKRLQHVDYWVSMGVSYNYLNRLPEAEKAYETAIKLDPTYAMSYYNLAIINARKGGFEKAVDLITQSLYYDPNYTIALIALGDFYVELEKNDLACNAYKRAEALGDTSVFGKRIRACKGL
ncbi:MAG: tetratricopeptide (TPR) repeat protein [Flavobacteriaceae bacterium]|jgi:tetratricopeptide (TPR) repeat protein